MPVPFEASSRTKIFFRKILRFKPDYHFKRFYVFSYKKEDFGFSRVRKKRRISHSLESLEKKKGCSKIS